MDRRAIASTALGMLLAIAGPATGFAEPTANLPSPAAASDHAGATADEATSFRPTTTVVADHDLSLLALRFEPHASSPHDGTASIVVRPATPRLESIRYRPRRQRSASAAPYGNSTQIHGGFFDPDGDAQRGILFGFRSGPRVDDHLQLGAGLDWRYRSQSYTELIGTGTGPGGEPIEIRRELASSHSNWIPVQVFTELNAGSDMGVIPYFGLGGGYQWLFINGDDYQTGTTFDATFGGWGWQAWGGVALPLGPRSRVNAEVFVNGSTLRRDSIDATSGNEVRESIDMDGVGMRFGVSWGFF